MVSSDIEVDDSPIEQVRLTVSITDDPCQPNLTFRAWVIGLLSCSILSVVNQYFYYHSRQYVVSSVATQILVLPLGNLMAATLPTTKFRIPFTKWEFSWNPGPFNMKEHVLITMFADAGSNNVYAVQIITMVIAFYRRNLQFAPAFLLALTSQMLGYGWAGLFRKYLVHSPYMWWPSNLVQVSLYRALHEKKKRPKGGLTRPQFFFLVFVCSFAYNIVPAYLFPSISSLSIVCYIWKNSVTAQQIGSGTNGLGIGSFGLCWSTVVGFLGNPLTTPGFAIINMLIGFIVIMYIVLPIAYWNNAYDAQKFPIVSSQTFDATGKFYNISRIINQKNFGINMSDYNSYSKLNLSILDALNHGLSFATLPATIIHVALFDGKTIWHMWRKTAGVVKAHVGDIHTRLMMKNYEAVPQSWFIIILVSMFGLALFACEGFGKQLQLPWWGVLMACGIAFFFTLPIGIIEATTGQGPRPNVIIELVMGLIHPGKPLSNLVFKAYGYFSMSQALIFLKNLKLGHYMKIPPKSMFIVQIAGTTIATSIRFATAWWLLHSVENICDVSKLPVESPWTCPNDDGFYKASTIWGLVGPLRVFTNKGNYPELNWFFLIGSLAPVPVWFLSKKFPNQKWIKLINMPVILGTTGSMQGVNYTWFAVGIFFNFYVYRKFNDWWAKHNHILSVAMDAGVAFSGVLIYFTLKDVQRPNWWGSANDDHCPLATCPTAPGVVATGCPVL